MYVCALTLRVYSQLEQGAGVTCAKHGVMCAKHRLNPKCGTLGRAHDRRSAERLNDVWVRGRSASD